MRRTTIIGFLATAFIVHFANAQSAGETSFSLYPEAVWFSESSPYGSFHVTNTGTTPVEVSIEIQYGTIGFSESNGWNTPMYGRRGNLRDLSEHIAFFPPKMIIPPGESTIARFTVDQAEDIPDGTYVALAVFTAQARAPVVSGQVPLAAGGVDVGYALVPHLVMFKGESSPSVYVEVLGHTSSQVSLLLRNRGQHPWAGVVQVIGPDENNLIGEQSARVPYAQRIDVATTQDIPSEIIIRFTSGHPSIPPNLQARIQHPSDTLITVR